MAGRFLSKAPHRILRRKITTIFWNTQIKNAFYDEKAFIGEFYVTVFFTLSVAVLAIYPASGGYLLRQLRQTCNIQSRKGLQLPNSHHTKCLYAYTLRVLLLNQ